MASTILEAIKEGQLNDQLRDATARKLGMNAELVTKFFNDLGREPPTSIDDLKSKLNNLVVRYRELVSAEEASKEIRTVIDIGYGDAIEPGLKEIELLPLLDQRAPKLRAYPPETVIAEKFQAMVHLGLANTRLKDFYDIWVLARTYEFKNDRLARAIKATFARRKTEIPAERPDALTKAFADDPTKIQQWNAFIQDVAIKPASLAEVIETLAGFLMPHTQKARSLKGD